ncbi:MAG: IPT/TIG domain-containing protein, partial [Vicinamibacterales bacterium]
MNLPRLRHAAGAALVAVIPFLGVACGSDSPSGPTSSTPKVSSVSPSSGSTTGSTSVTISGTGFASDATVSVGGVPATGVVVSGSTSITVVTGIRTTAGAGDVTVTTGGKTSTLSNGFTFVAPSGANRPPVIAAFRSIGSRNNQPSGFADIDETVQVLATVTDSETSNASLTHEWTAPGTLTPSGPTLTWKIPNSISGGTPATVTVGLKVTETFTEGGVTHTQSTSGSFPVRVHDSQKEIMDAGEDFLLLFSDSTKSTNEVLRNFSTTCDGGKGRQNEANDTDRNRAQYIQN